MLKILSITMTVSLLAFGFCEAGFKPFKGNEGDSDAIVNYIDKNLDVYFTVLDSLSNSEKRQDVNKTKRELERLALKIDAGDVKNEKLREKIIALRRSAIKSGNRNEFVIHSFERLQRNRLGGSMGTVFEGEAPSVSPYISYRLVNAKKRSGKKVLQCDYDVEEGDVVLFQEVKKHIPLKRYNAFRFKIKGDVGAVMMQIEAEEMHEFIVRGISDTWITVLVPFADFSKQDLLDKNEIMRINFVLSDQVVKNLQGTFFLDDFVLTKVAEVSEREKTVQVTNYEVEGTVPLGTDKSLFRK